MSSTGSDVKNKDSISSTTTTHTQTTTTTKGVTFRTNLIAPIIGWIAAAIWFSGAAVNTGQPRTGFDNNEGSFTAAGILYIIASAFFIMSTMVSVIGATRDAQSLKIGGKMPGIGWLIQGGAWFEFLASLTLLVGSAIFLGGSGSSSLSIPGIWASAGVASAGAIIMAVAISMWCLGASVRMIHSLIVVSVVAQMPDLVYRQRAWIDISSSALLVSGTWFWLIGAVATIVLTAPGFLLFGSIMWMFAALVLLAAFTVKALGASLRHCAAQHRLYVLPACCQ